MAKKQNKTTFGTIALAMFGLVLVSGIFLAIPFDVKSPYLSISRIIVSNPWASFIRNFHFWSSQFFLIFSLIHLYDHFHFKEKIGLNIWLSFRLSIGVLILFLAMISGFLLKGDADSLQARQILESLTQHVPVIGNSLAYSLLGKAGDYQLIYIHHVATFTIFITIITIEHSRKFWVPFKDFILSFVVISAFSYFFTATLHDNINPTIKGPWYFVGFQEILHWLRHPGWSLILILILLIFIVLVNYGKQNISLFSKRTLLIFTMLYFFLTVIGLFFRGEKWKWLAPGQADYNYSVLHQFKTSRVNFNPEFTLKEATNSPQIFGRKESCILCHTKTYGFADAHNPETIGCFSCHGGNPLSTVKNQSHKGMILIPGNLENSQQSCGTTQCHPEIVERVPTGLMATLSGMISVNRTVFGEQKDPDILTDVQQLKNSAADEHLKNLCVVCHLGNQKTELGSVKEWSRSGGCLACHLNYSEKAKKALHQSRTNYIRAHPSVSLQVTNKHCFGCHNRSGRISTNYEGWHETTLEVSEMPDSDNYRLIEGRRVFEKQQEDIHHKLGLECIDCHNSYELMGDGKHYAHEEDQEDVQCIDCHFSNEPLITEASDLENESAIIATLRFGNINDKKFLTTQKYGRALINTFVENDTAYMMTKNGGDIFTLTAPAEVCAGNNAHSSLSCSSCHSAWASSCIGCHNSYDKEKLGYNMLENKQKKGTWVEHKGTFSAKLPALGVRTSEGKKEIVPVNPGMILTLDIKSYTKSEKDSVIFRRLFSPIAPHTTSEKGRSCKSCHNNPVALGYGEGELKYVIQDNRGEWIFNPSFNNDINDGLPEDAWTGFLQYRSGMVSTRKNVFPFDVDEQKKILTVGACLTCHEENSNVMNESLDNFSKLIKEHNQKCKFPDWN